MSRHSIRSMATSVVLFFASDALAVTATGMRETQKVRPSDPVPAGQNPVSLSCARNEWCAFQVVVSSPAGASLTVSDVSLGDLSGPGGQVIAGSSAVIYTENFINISTPSNHSGATGLWPDALVPKADIFYSETRNAFPALVPAASNQPFWIELLIPMGQVAGLYAGNATVTASDGTSAQVLVSLQVRGFALPSTSSLTTAYGFDWDGPCVGHFGGYGPPNCDDQQLEALNSLYFKDALNHRLSISQAVYAPPITNGQGSWTTFDALYGPLLSGTALSGPHELAGAALTSLQYTGNVVSANYAAWSTQFAQMKWTNTLFDYTCDEPPARCTWASIPTRAATVHAGSPQFKTLVTTSIQNAQANGVAAAINIIVSIIDEMAGVTDMRSTYDSFLEIPGNQLWLYQSCEPSSSCADGTVGGETGWPTMFIDESAISNRIMQWMDFKYQVTGELYYDTTYAMATQDAWSSQYEFGNNGDGSIWYPGKPSVIGGTHDIPIESVRMKMIREGLQDYEYFNLLNQLGDAVFAQTELSSVVTAGYSYNSDPAVLEQARLAMAAEIEKDLGTATPDAGTQVDAGMLADDAGTYVDAGVITDGGGTVVDAGTVSVDAGETLDGGAVTGDAGTIADAGTPGSDAGAPSRLRAALAQYTACGSTSPLDGGAAAFFVVLGLIVRLRRPTRR